jgi:hypothetical protein
MALPKRGDPQRPLVLAIRSMRLLGIILIGFSILAMLPILLSGRARTSPGAVIGIGFMYVGPGILYLLCAIFLKRRRIWAIFTGLLLASIQLLLTIVMTLIACIMLLKWEPRMSAFFGYAMIPLAITLLLVTALVQLIYHLSKSFEAIKYSPIEQQRGFEPMIVQPIPPTESLRQS